MKIKNFALAILVVVIAFSAIVSTHTSVSAMGSATCGIGQAMNASGLCVNVTTQRPVVSQASKRASAYALCLTNTPNWTPSKQKSCMKAKGFK